MTMFIDILVAEIGSTTTLVNAFSGINTPTPRFIGQGQAPTSVLEGDVRVGLQGAVDDLARNLGAESIEYGEMFATSSAAGGLRMTVHGLVYDMTAKAAQAAALGAGAIIQMKGSVRGLTTAAGIWISACIGLAVGAGMYIISVIATLLIIFILVNIERIEQRANMLWETKVIRIKVGEIVTDRDACKAVFKQHKLHYVIESMKYDYEHNTSIINYRVLTRKSTDITSLFDELKEQYSNTLSISLTNEANL